MVRATLCARTQARTRTHPRTRVGTETLVLRTSVLFDADAVVFKSLGRAEPALM